MKDLTIKILRKVRSPQQVMFLNRADSDNHGMGTDVSAAKGILPIHWLGSTLQVFTVEASDYKPGSWVHFRC